MQKETGKQVAKKKAAPLALPEELQGDWGTEEITSEDVIIPRLLLMHGQSDFVQEGDRQIGELARSTDRALLGSKDSPVVVVPFFMYKTWVNEEQVTDGKKTKWEFRSVEPRVPENFNLPWEWQEKDGTQWRRNKTLNFYVLSLDDLKHKDHVFPLQIRFTRTSYKAGGTIADHFAHCKMEKMPPCLNYFAIGTKSEKRDHTYQTFTASKDVATTVEVIAMCKKWYEIISKDRAAAESQFKDHDEVDGSEEVAATEAQAGDQF